MKKDAILTAQDLVLKMGNPHEQHHHKVIRSLSETWGAWPSTSQKETWWVFREGMRFVHNIYSPVMPYDQEFHESFYGLWTHTLFHISIEDPTMVAFTPNPADGGRDRQVRSKMGKFLKRYQGKLHQFNDTVIADFANRFNTQTTPPRLTITHDTREMISVYKNGPHSCMSENFEAQEHHPVTAYARPPIGLAYVKLDDGRIVARALVRLDTMEFMRPYGNEFAIQKLLVDAGFRFSTKLGLGGLELNFMHTTSGSLRLVMPYFDPPAVFVDVNFKEQRIIVVDPSHEPGKPVPPANNAAGWIRYSAQTQGGYINLHGGGFSQSDDEEDDEHDENHFTCQHCEDSYHLDDLVPVGDNYVCSSCLANSEDYCEALLPPSNRRPGTAHRWRHSEDCIWVESLSDWIIDYGREEIESRYGLRWVEQPQNAFFPADRCVLGNDDDDEWFLISDAFKHYLGAVNDEHIYLQVGDTRLEEDSIFYISPEGLMFTTSKGYDNELQESKETPEGRIGTYEEFFTLVSRAIDIPTNGSTAFHQCFNVLRWETNGSNRPRGDSWAAFESFIGTNWTATRDAAVDAASRVQADAQLDSGTHHQADPRRSA